MDIAGTQYGGYHIDKIVSFFDVRAETYSVECTDVLLEDTYLEGHRLRLISYTFELIVLHFPKFNIK